MMKRRSFLQVLGGLASAVVAGCTGKREAVPKVQALEASLIAKHRDTLTNIADGGRPQRVPEQPKPSLIPLLELEWLF